MIEAFQTAFKVMRARGGTGEAAEAERPGAGGGRGRGPASRGEGGGKGVRARPREAMEEAATIASSEQRTDLARIVKSSRPGHAAHPSPLHCAALLFPFPVPPPTRCRSTRRRRPPQPSSVAVSSLGSDLLVTTTPTEAHAPAPTAQHTPSRPPSHQRQTARSPRRSAAIRQPPTARLLTPQRRHLRRRWRLPSDRSGRPACLAASAGPVELSQL
jgi:hypothetical protein